MNRLVLFPGVGADARLFEPQRSLSVPIEVPPWIEPDPHESLSHYAARLAHTIRTPPPYFVGGASFGGCVALEIARHVRPPGVILLSSCRSCAGIPRKLRIAGRAGRWVPVPVVAIAKRLPALGRQMFGSLTPEQSALFDTMLADTPARHLKWTVGALLGWGGAEDLPRSIYHVHGGADQILPCGLGRPDFIVNGAGHLMNVTHASEVNAALDTWLRKQKPSG